MKLFFPERWRVKSTRDKGGDQQISTATRILAEVIASDASWLMAFNSAIDHVIQNNQKARQNLAIGIYSSV